LTDPYRHLEAHLKDARGRAAPLTAGAIAATIVEDLAVRVEFAQLVGLMEPPMFVFHPDPVVPGVAR